MMLFGYETQPFDPFLNESSLNPQAEGKVVQFIEKINERYRLWTTEERTFNTPVPNMTGLAPGVPKTYQAVVDVISDQPLDPMFVQLVCNLVAKAETIFLYVHDGPFGFHPVFAIMQRRGTENITLLKFIPRQIAKEQIIELEKLLYCEKTLALHSAAMLPPIRAKLADYDY